MNKLTSLVLLSITGTMKTTSTTTLEIMLNVIPLDIYIKQVATITLSRLDQTNSLESGLLRHSEIVQDWKNHCNTDYITPYNVMENE